MGDQLRRIGKFTIDYRIIDDDPLIAKLMLSDKVIVQKREVLPILIQTLKHRFKLAP